MSSQITCIFMKDSPRQDSSGVESQAEPTISTGGGFGKGPALSHCKAIC